MKRPEPDSPGAQQRAHAAAEWLARRDRGLTAAEQDEFLQWLAADPRHGEWFALHRYTVGDFGALAQWRHEHSEEPNPDLLAPTRRVLRWPIRFALAAAAAVAVGLILWQVAPNPESHETIPAFATELERRILADGSSVELNRGAVVTIALTATERRATLVRGEALFTVAKDAQRPFIVRAGNVDVRAIGTAFAVRLDPAAVEVLVTEGKVALESNDAATGSSAPSSTATSSGTFPNHVTAPTATALGAVTAGQRATVFRDIAKPPEIVAVTPAVTAQLLTWQPQMLDFSSAPLAAALHEFNRRNRVQFVLADADLGMMPIVATIRSDNVEGFARFLAATPGLEVERRSDFEIVLRRTK